MLEMGIAGNQLQIYPYEIWVYSPLEDAVQTVSLEDMQTYIYRRHNMATQYIATRTIIKLFLEAELIPGS